MTGPEVPGGFARLVGLRPVAMEDGRAVFEVGLGPDHLNPYGVVHGGVVYSLVDTAMGGALVSRLEPGERCLTLEIKVNYVTAATGGVLRCQATLLERTRRIGVLEAQVRTADDRLVAVASGSFYITSGYNTAP